MPVALDDLRGNLVGLQTEFLADVLSRPSGSGARSVPTAPEILPTAIDVAGALEPFERPAKLVVHQRHLQAERDRLGVDAVRAADHRA